MPGLPPTGVPLRGSALHMLCLRLPLLLLWPLVRRWLLPLLLPLRLWLIWVRLCTPGRSAIVLKAAVASATAAALLEATTISALLVSAAATVTTAVVPLVPSVAGDLQLLLLGETRDAVGRAKLHHPTFFAGAGCLMRVGAVATAAVAAADEMVGEAHRIPSVGQGEAAVGRTRWVCVFTRSHASF